MKMKTEVAWPKLSVRYENVPTLIRKSHAYVKTWVNLKLEIERENNFLVSFNTVIDTRPLQTVGLEFIARKVKGFPFSVVTGSSFCSMMPNAYLTFSLCFIFMKEPVYHSHYCDWARGCLTKETKLSFHQKQEIFTSLKLPDWCRAQPGFLLSGYCGLFSHRKLGQDVYITNH